MRTATHPQEVRAPADRQRGTTRIRSIGRTSRTAPGRVIVRPVPPFRLDLTVWALRRRARNAIDRWDGGTYRRAIVLGGRTTALSVRQLGSPDAPRLVVTSTPSPRTAADRRRLRSMVDRLLGTAVNLDEWYRMAAHDRRLGVLAERFRGLKPPRFPTVFEALVNAFACQQLSLEVGLELLNRLATISAVQSGTVAGGHCGFPSARDIMRLPPSRYQDIGFSRQKVRALVALAGAVERDDIDLEVLADRRDADVCARLLELRGVGRWTAEYVLLRGFGRLHVFPGDDVGAQKRLARWLGRSSPLDYAGVHRAVANWSPYAGLVYFHLLLDGLSQAGALGDSQPSGGSGF
jgi:DNA-3-methyladenine glycosylase II